MVQGEKKGGREPPGGHALCSHWGPFNWDQDNLVSSNYEVAARTKKAPGQGTGKETHRGSVPPYLTPFTTSLHPIRGGLGEGQGSPLQLRAFPMNC